MSKPKPKTTKPEPNTIFAGKREKWNKQSAKLEKVPTDAPAFIINGLNKINLPDAIQQKKGFHLETAQRNVVMNLFPDYKTLKKT